MTAETPTKAAEAADARTTKCIVKGYARVWSEVSVDEQESEDSRREIKESARNIREQSLGTA